MRSPEEIKKTLEICGQAYSCLQCPYKNEKTSPYGCGDALDADALALILHLEPFKALVKQYIQKHNITCSESIWQMDKPQVDAIVLADELCKLVLKNADN